MCPDTKALLAYVKLELFLADICYYIKINPKPITAMAKKIAEDNTIYKIWPAVQISRPDLMII